MISAVSLTHNLVTMEYIYIATLHNAYNNTCAAYYILSTQLCICNYNGQLSE